MTASRAPEDERARQSVLDHADGLPAPWADEAGWLRSFPDVAQYPTRALGRQLLENRWTEPGGMGGGATKGGSPPAWGA